MIDWRYGRTTPSAPVRAALWSAYEIPAPAWGRLPAGMHTDSEGAPGTASSAAVSPVPAPELAGNGHSHTNGHAPDSLAETATLLAQIRRQLSQTDLLASDRARITDTYTKTLAFHHRLQQQADLTEDRIIRDHPTWQRIRLELARVLARYPDVANEVCAALERLGM